MDARSIVREIEKQEQTQWDRYAEIALDKCIVEDCNLAEAIVSAVKIADEMMALRAVSLGMVMVPKKTVLERGIKVPPMPKSVGLASAGFETVIKSEWPKNDVATRFSERMASTKYTEEMRQQEERVCLEHMTSYDKAMMAGGKGSCPVTVDGQKFVGHWEGGKLVRTERVESDYNKKCMPSDCVEAPTMVHATVTDAWGKVTMEADVPVDACSRELRFEPEKSFEERVGEMVGANVVRVLHEKLGPPIREVDEPVSVELPRELR